MKKSLEAIIGPLTSSEFIVSYKSNTPVVVHNIGDNIKELCELPFLRSFESMFNFWPKIVVAYLSGLADEVNSKEVSVIESMELFKQGRSLLFNDANDVSPVIGKWVESIRRDLGLSRLTYGRSLIYATPAGCGTDAHFDQNTNFVVQIHGQKKWWIAPNTSVENPLTRHVIGVPADPELASYAGEQMPSEFPENATEYTLAPGSMLFVPRGAWHKTSATTDSLSLNLTYTAPTWIDILTTAMRGRLAMSSEWRQTADFVTDENLCGEALDNFDMLLSQLAFEIPEWCAAHILDATEMDQLPSN
ncbi:MAG: hypothetical protein HOE90_03410 [Bacteriovoracaceae bacterium]|jgi:50S ribosomal protein L16 3-hydroxylase|nr:hypothetical protein [Bacteriovoracaceae bacterium]